MTSVSTNSKALPSSTRCGVASFSPGFLPPICESIAAVTVVKALDKDAYLFHEGDAAQGFYIVQRGAVNVHRVSAAGKEQIIHVFRTGDSFAEVALASEKGYPADARALESSQVLARAKEWDSGRCCAANRNSRCGCSAR
jgi:CRP-like cAMP-binding protein